MKKRIAWAGGLLSVVAIGALLWRVDLRELGRALGRADLRWLAASYAVFFVMFFLRAYRWSRLLGGTPLGVTWHANTIGYMFNILLPLRLGEIARAWVIAKKTNVTMAAALSGVLVERLIDLGAVLLMFAGLAQLVPMGPSFNRAAIVGSIALAGGVVAVIIVIVKGDATDRLLRPRLGHRADALLAKLGEIRAAFRAIGTPRRLLECAVLTVVLWASAIVTTQLCMMAFLPTETDATRAGLVVVATNLGGAVPSAPGGLGIVQGFATSALVVPFGIPEGRALAVVLVLSLGQQLVLVLLGLVSMARIGTSFGEIKAGVDGR